jgi:tripartite-type tricarboxylate transporter receptor subunit TctC
MRSGHGISLACGLAYFLAPIGSVAQEGANDAVADFYKGRQVTIVVGYGPGGSASFYAQALAHHMGRFLPGRPGMVVQHMPGAGGLLAANNLYNSAARDGTVFAITGRTVGIEPLLGNGNAKYDGRKFNWLGTANVEYTTCLSWHTSPVKTLHDAMLKELVVGGTGSDATDVIFPKAANKLVGTRFKIVVGYQSSAEMNLAMERGELEGNCGLGWTIVKLRKPEWLRDKKINVLFQMGLHKHPDIPDVPLISDYAKTPADRQVFDFLFAPQEMGRPFFAPPDVPPARAKALRDAFARTLKDAQFLAEADKMGLEVQHVGGEEIDKLLQRLYATPPAVIERVKAVAE